MGQMRGLSALRHFLNAYVECVGGAILGYSIMEAELGYGVTRKHSRYGYCFAASGHRGGIYKGTSQYVLVYPTVVEAAGVSGNSRDADAWI